MTHQRFTLAYIMILAGIAWVGGCTMTTTSSNQSRPLPSAKAVEKEPTVRVRIERGSPAVRITGPQVVNVMPVGTDARIDASFRNTGRAMPTPLTFTRRGNQFILTQPDGSALAWSAEALAVSAPGAVYVEGSAFPGHIVVHASGTNVDAINHVPMEQYIPGVLQKELFASWHANTYAAQAVAARTYAMYSQHLNSAKHYDVESTVASQAYIGLSTSSKAVQGAATTRGLALTWQGRIFPAYYSSCAGGAGQDGPIAFPRKSPNIPPLMGRPRGQWGRSSPNFAWGPIRRDASQLSQRLAAWGRSNGDAIHQLRGIRAIQVTSRNSAGRPAGFRVTDGAGRAFNLGPESFRHACNQDVAGLAKVDKARQIKSSFFDVQVAGGAVIFTNGRGYGHGVGLDQWGSNDLAAAGYNPASILAFYYPGAKLERLY